MNPITTRSSRIGRSSVLGGTANTHASVPSFADSFWLVAFVFVETALLILLVGKVKPA